jgi:hypothetical protein
MFRGRLNCVHIAARLSPAQRVARRKAPGRLRGRTAIARPNASADAEFDPRRIAEVLKQAQSGVRAGRSMRGPPVGETVHKRQTKQSSARTPHTTPPLGASARSQYVTRRLHAGHHLAVGGAALRRQSAMDATHPNDRTARARGDGPGGGAHVSAAIECAGLKRLWGLGSTSRRRSGATSPMFDAVMVGCEAVFHAP